MHVCSCDGPRLDLKCQCLFFNHHKTQKHSTKGTSMEKPCKQYIRELYGYCFTFLALYFEKVDIFTSIAVLVSNMKIEGPGIYLN